MHTRSSCWAVAIGLVGAFACVACASEPAKLGGDQPQEVVIEARGADELFRAGAGLSVLEASRLTEFLGGEEFVLVPVASGVHLAGVGIGVGASAGETINNEVRDGLFWVPEGGILHDGDGFPTIVAPRSLLVIGRRGMNLSVFGQASGNGGVECGPGYYACCGKNIHGQWRARCVQNNQVPPGGADGPTTCIHGGEGATACTNGTSIIAFQTVPPVVNPNEATRLTPD